MIHISLLISQGKDFKTSHVKDFKTSQGKDFKTREKTLLKIVGGSTQVMRRESPMAA